ncbi:MAG: hypothetical protein GY811_07990 [Myxococcales bacterium]|nr:hypothetical protein [Myxococcales bacterium]
MADLADYKHPNSVRKLLQSMARVVCPAKAQELDLIDDIVDHVELSMCASPAGIRVALLAGFSGYELASMVFPAHLGVRASKLDAEKARSYFDSWFHSKLAPQHEFAKGVKGLISLACYEQPAMMADIGYTPQKWIDKSTRYRLQTYADEIVEREAEILAPDPLPNVIGPAHS